MTRVVFDNLARHVDRLYGLLDKIALVAANNRITDTLIDYLYGARVITVIIVYTPAIM